MTDGLLELLQERFMRKHDLRGAGGIHVILPSDPERHKQREILRQAKALGMQLEPGRYTWGPVLEIRYIAGNGDILDDDGETVLGNINDRKVQAKLEDLSTLTDAELSARLKALEGRE